MIIFMDIPCGQKTIKNIHMKKLLTIFLLSIGLSLISFKYIEGLDEVIYALNQGNAVEMGKHFDETVDISMPDKSDSYSKAQAVLILKDFFKNSGIKSFEVKHKGDNGNDLFCIGTLQTKNGNYRTTVFMRQKGIKQVVKEIRIQ